MGQYIKVDINDFIDTLNHALLFIHAFIEIKGMYWEYLDSFEALTYLQCS